MTAPGKFISFEGIDGAGKSTHIAHVAELLRASGKTVVTTREPGGTALGERIRELVLHESMHLETEALLMFAARREHLAQVIMPALARGEWVISDRFTDASYAYQGGGRELARDKLEALERWVHPGFQPDLTFLFDLPVEIAHGRISNSRQLDKFESEQARFFESVRAEYSQRSKLFPNRFRIIDSRKPVEEIKKLLEEIILSICN